MWAPLLGYALAHVFLHDPMLALGFLLVMVVPCSSMSIAYTGLAGGDVELATVIVGSSFVLAVLAVPLWMGLFAAQYDVPIPMHDMLTSILTVLIAPMLAGWLTRRVVQRTRGEASLNRLQPAFSAASMLAMFAIIFLIFFAKAGLIVQKWPTVVLLLVPNALFIAVTLLLATWLNRRLGLSLRRAHGDRVRQHRQEQRHRDRDRRDGVLTDGRDPRRDHADLPGAAAGRLPQTRLPAAPLLP